MSLRARLAITLALVTAVAIGLAAVGSYVLTARELRASIDDELVRQARVGGILLDRPLADRPLTDRPLAGRPNSRVLDAIDAEVQFLRRNGEPYPGLATIALPVDDADRVLAAAGSGQRFRTAEVDGTTYRILTIGGSLRGQGGGAQLARDLTESRQVLTGLRRRLLLVLGLGAGAAALVGVLVADRLARPLRRLAAAAAHVAATQDLRSPSLDDLAGGRSGSDEVGRLAASFTTMLGALETSRAQQQRLVMDASHELRTPLTSLRTNVELLRRAPNLPADDRAALLSDLDREVQELTNLSAELVELATSAQRSDEATTAVDLAEIATAVAVRAQHRSGRDVSVIVGSRAELVGRVHQLERAITNLVENALKFSPPDTPVIVTVDGRSVRVADRGPGIPPEDRALVFDRFYRSVTTRDAPGSGLGLAIVADIVTAHGGSVIVEDNPGGGAVVGFSL